MPLNRGMPWSEEEHVGFLEGLTKLGKGNWKMISRDFVPTRNPTQVASHAQKHFLRLQGCVKRRSRFTVIEAQARNTAAAEVLLQAADYVCRSTPPPPPSPCDSDDSSCSTGPDLLAMLAEVASTRSATPALPRPIQASPPAAAAPPAAAPPAASTLRRHTAAPPPALGTVMGFPVSPTVFFPQFFPGYQPQQQHPRQQQALQQAQQLQLQQQRFSSAPAAFPMYHPSAPAYGQQAVRRPAAHHAIPTPSSVSTGPFPPCVVGRHHTLLHSAQSPFLPPRTAPT